MRKFAALMRVSTVTVYRELRKHATETGQVLVPRKREPRFDPESAEQPRPWEAEGISRTTLFRRKARQNPA